jgi:sugar phosphate isomerase/epimerase
MMMSTHRRQFLQNLGILAAGFALAPDSFASMNANVEYKLSLAQWSLHRMLRSGKLDNLDFPAYTKKQFNISIVEYVNQFFMDKASDTKYLSTLLSRCKDNGVKNHLIMVDQEGDLGASDKEKRQKAVDNHLKWVDAAKLLECATIRVNAHGNGSAAALQDACAEGISKLGAYARQSGINVIIENHGGMSGNGEWLLGLIKKINMKNVGILPDFGNFCIRREGGQMYSGKCVEEYDRYKAVKLWMPYSKGVSAKTLDFNAAGNCVETDYIRMMQIVKKSGFKGIIGIEYEGDKLNEDAGILATKALLQKVGKSVGYTIS